MTSSSNLVSFARWGAGFFGTLYGWGKLKALEEYVKTEDQIKSKAFQELGIDPHSIAAVSLFAPKLYDPVATEENIRRRHLNPSYYLSPSDEWAYQNEQKRQKFFRKALALEGAKLAQMTSERS